MMMFARTVIGLMQAPGFITRAFQSESDDRRREENNNLTTGSFSDFHLGIRQVWQTLQTTQTLHCLPF